MADTEALIQPSPSTVFNQTTDVLESFRDYHAARGSVELGRMPLIATHDSSIRFTNSTTSVMKALITDGFEDLTYLTQPAMGSQGIEYWLRDRTLGPYASYFTSLGSIYQPSEGLCAINIAVELTTKTWGIEDAEVHVYESDSVIIGLLHEAGISPVITRDDVSDFRHTYGIDTIVGRNANIISSGRVLGNITLIESKEPDNVLAWEVAFDSTPVVATMLRADHAIASTPAAAIINLQQRRESLVAADCVNISAALGIEGLEPRSKGKAGTLRKFFKEYVKLVALAGYSPSEAMEVYREVQHVDYEIRKSMSPKLIIDNQGPTPENTVEQWIHSFWPVDKQL